MSVERTGWGRAGRAWARAGVGRGCVPCPWRVPARSHGTRSTRGENRLSQLMRKRQVGDSADYIQLASLQILYSSTFVFLHRGRRCLFRARLSTARHSLCSLSSLDLDRRSSGDPAPLPPALETPAVLAHHARWPLRSYGDDSSAQSNPLETRRRPHPSPVLNPLGLPLIPLRLPPQHHHPSRASDRPARTHNLQTSRMRLSRAAGMRDCPCGIGSARSNSWRLSESSALLLIVSAGADGSTAQGAGVSGRGQLRREMLHVPALLAFLLTACSRSPDGLCSRRHHPQAASGRPASPASRMAHVDCRPTRRDPAGASGDAGLVGTCAFRQSLY